MTADAATHVPHIRHRAADAAAARRHADRTARSRALLAAIDQTIVGTAEPRIIAQLSGFDRYPWVATAYLLTSTVSVPIFASLSDIYGRKPFFLLGATLFVATSALCGAAGKLTFLPIDGMGQLILFRGLQGIGAGMVIGLLFTIVGDIFSPAERGRYQGLFAARLGRRVDLRTRRSAAGSPTTGRGARAST